MKVARRNLLRINSENIIIAFESASNQFQTSQTNVSAVPPMSHTPLICGSKEVLGRFEGGPMRPYREILGRPYDALGRFYGGPMTFWERSKEVLGRSY